MKILFIHQNFPGQFKFLAPALAAQGHQVRAMLMNETTKNEWQGVQLFPYRAARSSSASIHPWVADIETKTIRGEACFRKALKMKADGYTPDLVIAHPGWGESLFIKEVWPGAKLGIYCEFYYQAEGADLGFDPEFLDTDEGRSCRIHLKNLNNLLHAQIADAGLSPTAWQANSYPENIRSKISIIHDGIDTSAIRPNPDVEVSIRSDITLNRQTEVITFVSRNLEPYRGFHIFMRTLPALLKARPNAHILVIGGDDISYGTRPPASENWRSVLTKEVRPAVSDADWQRVHFLGKLPYPQFIALLQTSTVHIYLTYPFVLSWSLLEAMSVGASIVASDTAPVREVIRHGENGKLVDFFDGAALIHETCALLDNPAERRRLGDNAREFVKNHFDLQSVCLPQQLEWVAALKDHNRNAQ